MCYIKIMKKPEPASNIGQLLLELTVTIIVAFLLSMITWFVISFVLGVMGKFTDYQDIVNLITGAVFGFVIAYKAKVLLRQSK